MAERRLAITIKGGISLGSYEAGVLTETLNLIAFNNRKDHTTPKWYIDALAGASAGSVTAAMTALALLSGDPAILHEIWVNLLSLDRLAPENDSKLSDNQLLDSGMLDQLAQEHLRLARPLAGKTHPALRPNGEIQLRFTLSHQIGELQSVPTINAGVLQFNLFKDSASFKIVSDPNAFRLESDGFAAHGYSGDRVVVGGDAWNALVQCAISSGSFPFAFAPRHLRKWDDVLRWSDSHYQDGGIYDNDPVGQSINLAHEIDWYGPNSAGYQDEDRRFLIVHTAPFKGFQKAAIPSAPQLLDINPFKLAVQLLPNIFEASMTSGLAGIGEVNQLFEVRRQFLETLLDEAKGSASFPALQTIIDSLASMRKITKDQLQTLLQALVPDLQRSQSPVDQRIGAAVKSLSDPQQANFTKAALAFDLALDIADKVHFYPMLIAPTGGLSGDPAGGFGGFLLRELRERDFQQGVADAYREWKSLFEQSSHEFVVSPEAPPTPITADELANQREVKSQYSLAAKRLVQRMEAVITGFAKGATEKDGLLGIIKAKAIEAVGDYAAKRFGNVK